MASEKEALENLQTAAYLVAQSRDFADLMERHSALLGLINVCNQTLDSLADCLAVSGLDDVRGDAFQEWLCEVGMCRLRSALRDINGSTLAKLTVNGVMDRGVSFCDAAALQLRGYIAHHKLSDDVASAPPRDSVLAWTVEQTAKWIETLGNTYACLVGAGWHGAALCSLLPLRVAEASKGALAYSDAVKFIGLVRAKQSEVDGDKDEWVAKWTGTATIADHSSDWPF